MGNKKYVVGVDFGTLSGRAVVVDVANGDELSESVYEYPHAVMDRELPCGVKLDDNFALQHPADYIETLSKIIPDAVSKAGLKKEDICGLGIDFTACTLIPTYEDGTPLCFDEKFKCNPHAYVKLWKHHAAQPEADAINKIAAERGEDWLAVYGGKVSSEWALPKIWQTLDEAPEVYEAADRFTEAADWLSFMLTGVETHAAVFAGYKALWNAESGYPSGDFCASLDERMRNIVGTKLSEKVLPVNEIAGLINEKGAEITGLAVGTPLALPMIDAHAALPALNITADGELVIIMGTSSCHIINSKKEIKVPGICGYVKDGVVPGYYTYEAGQACVGDGFDRFVKKCVPESYTAEAKQRDISIHKLLREKAEKLAPGESGLLCLDWFNGNRSVLVDADLSGMILGLTLNTMPEEIYRALIEATAYGTRMIIDTFEQSGIEIKSICACGGIARKDAMMMQIYADVTGREIRIAGTTQAGALGSAIYASVAGGAYGTITEAAENISKPDHSVYHPNLENKKIYDKLYAEYALLHDYFGRGENDVMKRLAALKK
ncbi:MAG: ribulokinase [Clostridia bacterium]|nr:ribulokinase [Clostridia bacterium]